MTLISHIFSPAMLSKSHKESLEGIEWYVFNESDYVDMETSVTYRQRSEASWDFESLDAQAVFDLDNKLVQFTIGTNLGDGFNSKFTFNFDANLDVSQSFDTAAGACKDSQFIQLLREFHDEADELKQRIQKLVIMITDSNGKESL